MKFVCKQEVLLKAIQTVQNVVPNKNPLAILGNVLIEADNDKVRFVGTDMEVGLRCYMQAEVLKKGSVTIPAKKLAEIVKELPQKDIEISVNESNQMEINYGSGKVRLFGLPVDDYPVLPEFKEEKSFAIEQKLFKEMINKTFFAVSIDPARRVLNGAFLTVEKKKATLVSTDGYRLALIEKNLEKEADESKSAIIPSKALAELTRVLSDKGEVKILILENQILFLLEDLLLTSRLIDGQFPNYDQVIPKKTDKKIKVNVQDFLKASRRVSVFSTDKAASIKLEAKKDKLLVRAETPELGDASEELEAKYDGESILVAYNARYIQDVLKAVDEPELNLELSEPLNPALLKPVDNSSYLCVIMPMRV